MNGPTVLLLVAVIAVLATVAFLLLDESVDRWLLRRSVKRDDQRALAEREAMQRELAPKFPRSTP